MPTEDELAAAPLLDDWYLYPARPGVAVMVGTVSGHPRLPDGPVTTSRVTAYSEQEGWCETLNRTYRLGRKYEPKPVRVSDGKPGRPIQLTLVVEGSPRMEIIPGVHIPAYDDKDDYLPKP